MLFASRHPLLPHHDSDLPEQCHRRLGTDTYAQCSSHENLSVCHPMLARASQSHVRMLTADPPLSSSLRRCIIVDSSRRKRMPDSFSRTIPVWAACINRAVHNFRCVFCARVRALSFRMVPCRTSRAYYPVHPLTSFNAQSPHECCRLKSHSSEGGQDPTSDLAWDTELHTPPAVVSRSEHEQMERVLPALVAKLEVRFCSAVLPRWFYSEPHRTCCGNCEVAWMTDSRLFGSLSLSLSLASSGERRRPGGDVAHTDKAAAAPMVHAGLCFASGRSPRLRRHDFHFSRDQVQFARLMLL